MSKGYMYNNLDEDFYNKMNFYEKNNYEKINNINFNLQKELNNVLNILNTPVNQTFQNINFNDDVVFIENPNPDPFQNKYLKYKQKYLELKKELNKLNL